jgi:hypothetical protein
MSNNFQANGSNDKEIFIERLSGLGPLNFVLVHNAGGDHHFFTYQIEMLKKYGDVIWVDLPGHGSSKMDNVVSDYSMDALSLFIVQICEKLALNNISLIGLNNGADIVLNTVLKHTLPIHSIILIDPPIFMGKHFVCEIEDFIKQLECTDYPQFAIQLVDALLSKEDVVNKQLALNAFNRVDRQVLQNIFRGLIAWDKNSSGRLQDIYCPALCISTDEHHCSYKKIIKEAPQFEIGKVVGSKCWATLEVPDQINAMIERFLKLDK